MELVLNSDWHDVGRRKLEAVKAAVAFDEARLMDLLQTFISYEGRRGSQTSQRTRDSYETGVRRWLRFCRPDETSSPAVPILRATADDCKVFAANLLGEGLKPESVAMYLSSIKAFYAALVWAKALEVNPAEGVRRPRDSRARHERRDPVPLDGYKRMLELAVHPRDECLLRMMGDQGLRISEVAALELADVAGGVVRVMKGKGGKSRKVPMTASTSQAVSRWLSVRQADAIEAALFVNLPHVKTKPALVGRRMSADTIRTLFKGLLRAAGLPENLSPHSLRHTAGTRLYRSTRDLFKVAQILGHSDINTSSIYSKMDLESLQDTMSLLDD